MWQQASKHINQSVISATVSIYRSYRIVLNREKKGKENSEVID
jgi:hypothetical protein